MPIMIKARVKDWESHQHYKDRCPPWIKLHRGLLDDFDYHRLPVASKALAPLLWLLASDNDGEIDADPEYIAFRFRMTPAEASAALNPLIDNGWLILEHGASMALAGCKHDACLETETETETETEKTPLSSSRKRKPDRGGEVREVFEFWQSLLDHPRAKLDDKRRRKIRDRLNDGYSVDELKSAVVGCSKSPHNMGENDRATKYDDIELICRDATHVDRFLKLADGPDLTKMSASARRTVDAAREWADE